MPDAPGSAAAPRLGAVVGGGGTRFAVWSGAATRVWVSLFDGDDEVARQELRPDANAVFSTFVPGLGDGACYGFRADGPYDPENGLWFDPDKLLVDPYAVEFDRPFSYDQRLTLARGAGVDTAPLVPKSVARAPADPVPARPPLFRPGGLIYEVPVRAFSMLHPGIPQELRGTVAALAHPAAIDHFMKIGVSAVELMPVTAWIDERHLPPLGLANAWGYNPVAFMALDPRLAPGGVAELRRTVAALRAAGIGTILDLVFNHSGESDVLGPTLSLRGLDALAYYRHRPGLPARLVNDTGTGNTLACDRPVVRRLILDSLRHFVLQAGVDGFRFDLAPILGRTDGGFDRRAALFTEMRDDPVLADRVLIAEPWDVGRDGYQLGNFERPFLEWNDRYRDDVRRFWRGDAGALGALATRLAGSSDVFSRDGAGATRTVNFVAAHDGMTLADLTAYAQKRNEANGEDNRDGHDENFSWNEGIEGQSDDPAVAARRAADVRALLATLFASRGTVMLTAGDEFGRTQRGNNNAYAQDNALTWLDWQGRDVELEGYVAALARLRESLPALGRTAFLSGTALGPGDVPDAEWLTETGAAMDEAAWRDPGRRRLALLLGDGRAGRLAVLVNGDRRATTFSLPERSGFAWWRALPADPGAPLLQVTVEGRAVVFVVERESA